MLQYVAIITFAVGMGGMLNKLGVLNNILSVFTKHIHSDGALIFATIMVGYVTSIVSCSSPMSHVLTGTLMKPLFEERKIEPENPFQMSGRQRHSGRPDDSVARLRKLYGRYPWSYLVPVHSVCSAFVADAVILCFLWVYGNFH